MSSPPDLCLLDTKYHFAEFIAFRLFSFLVNKTNFSYFIILYHCNISGWANFPYVQPIRINIFYRIIYAITIWRPRIVLLRQRILREPPSPIGIVHARPEIDIGKTQKCLLLLSGEPMTVVGNRSRNRSPSFAERIVIVLFDHRTVGGDNLPHAAQMIRQEITRFQTLRRDYEPSSAERGTFQVERSVLRPIYQRTQITQPVAGGLRRREFRLLKCKRLSRPCLQVRKITTKIKVLNV